MKKPKSSFNWYFLLAGILTLYFGLTTNQASKQTSLEKITVELDKDIISVKGRRRHIDYKFWTKQYKNQFNILNGSITRGKDQAISDLKSGQVVDLYISTSDYNSLSDEKINIDIVGINLDGFPLITTSEFYHNRELYLFRLKIFSVFASLMLLLNGLAKIPKKMNYTIVGTFIGIIIFMRIFEIVIY